jgi:hypothetical protein
VASRASTPYKHKRKFKLAQAGSLVRGQIRDAASSRGFSESKVLTHWAEIAGPDFAQIARPIEVSYGRGGFGATLLVLTTGAFAPILELQKEQLRAKVNSSYGYNAISRIRITQTAPRGFAEGRVEFTPNPKAWAPKPPTPEACARAAHNTKDVADEGLRAALERLGAHILSKPNSSKG